MPRTMQPHPKPAHEISLLWRLTEKTRSPWHDWDLDKTFFQSLSRYIMVHPEGRLDLVLDRITTAIEQSQDYLELIPDNPFPAQSLVKALGCLLQLGIKVKRAKRDVFEFAKQVVEWVQAVQSAFEGVEHNKFGFLTWRSLRKTRDLINEICSWANSRLKENRWTRMQNGFRIGKEIDEFKARLEDAKKLFRDVSLLHLQGGMSVILSGIRSILFRQDEILEQIRKVKKQQRDQLAYIINELEEMKSSQVREAFLKETLGTHTVSKSSYDAQGKYPCDEGTRKSELEDILQWLNLISPGSQNFLWLTGDPGCGKSAITASVARHCKDEGVLWGQFFINRNIVETTNPNTFFPTIARQLAKFSVEVEQMIHDQLKAELSLADQMTPDQASKLFINVLAAAATLDSNKVVAVIIDGLDETDKNHSYATAKIISHLFTSLARYPNAKVFMSSRTESSIQEHFAGHADVKYVHLDTQDSIGDVALFMRREIKETIVERYQLKWEEWPTEEGMELLAVRASGLFIWAVTAVRYLQEKFEEDGQGCRQFVMRQLTGKSLEGINNLYALILQSIRKKHATEMECEFEIFQEIIGAIIILREPLCLDDLSRLLDLRYGPENLPVDVKHFVQRLRTVLVAGASAIDGKTVPRLHKSFFEFITDATVFGQLSLNHRFYVDPAVAEERMALCCIRLFASSRKDKGKSSLGKGSFVEYTMRFCVSHVDAVAKKASVSAVGLVTLGRTIEDIQNKFSTCCLTPWFPFDFDGSPPAHFSPLTAVYKRAGNKRILATVKFKVFSLAYSPNGEVVVSGSYDGRLILWNVKDGTEIAELKGHTNIVHSVVFSPSGDRIASGSWDLTVRIWDVGTTKLVHTLCGHSDGIPCVTFSPVENVVASASVDQTVRLWNVDSGKSIGSPFKHDSWVWSVTFSTDRNEIISGADNGLVYFWNRHTGECQQKLKSTTSEVYSVAVSPLGDRLVAVGNGGLCIWNKTDSGFVLDDRLTLKLGNGGYSSPTVFSPDGRSVLVSDRNNSQIFLYDLNIHTKITIHDERIGDFSLSLNGSSVIFSADRKIHISDVPRLLPATSTALSPDAEIAVCILSDGSVWIESPKNLPVVSKQLEGKVGSVKNLTFSSDNSLLAAVDDDSLYLWDVSTLKFRGHASIKNSLSPITTLSFLADKCTVATTHEDQSKYFWDAIDGTLHPRPMNSSSDITFDHQLLLDVDPDHARETAGARWYPAKSNHSGLWAYVDGTLIRAKRDGTVILLPLDSV